MNLTQRFSSWMETGGGAVLVKGAAVVMAVLLFTVAYCYKRQAGAANEEIIEQAVVGRQLAEGNGFSTVVYHPQAIAFLEKNEGWEFEPAAPIPDLYHAPLYPMTISLGIKAMWPSLAEKTWAVPTQKVAGDWPGFNGDVFLLVLNAALFCFAMALVYTLGALLFSSRAGVLAVAGTLLSAGIWDDVIDLGGTTLVMVLVLLLFVFWALLERAQDDEETPLSPVRAILWALPIGVCCALLFLAEYTAGLLVFVFWAYCGLAMRNLSGLAAALTVTLVFALGTSWWISRNMELTGSPVALAGQNISLKSGDSTAEPEVARSLLSAEWPEFSLRKMIGKGLAGIKENFQDRIWSGGAHFYAAFFLGACLYRFRQASTDVLRWCGVGTVLVLLTLPPFFQNGLHGRQAAVYLAPLMIVFGSGFFFVLLESTKRRAAWEKILVTLVFVGIHGMTVAHDISEPRRLPFRFPPYLPVLMAKTETGSMSKIRKFGYGMMSDVPAGLAWYSQQPVWAQPHTYPDFVKVIGEYQNIGLLLLSPKVLDKPYFSQLLRADIDNGEQFEDKRYWGAIYGSLQKGELPAFFPLRQPAPLANNMYLLINPAVRPILQ